MDEFDKVTKCLNLVEFLRSDEEVEQDVSELTIIAVRLLFVFVFQQQMPNKKFELLNFQIDLLVFFEHPGGIDLANVAFLHLIELYLVHGFNSFTDYLLNLLQNFELSQLVLLMDFIFIKQDSVFKLELG